MGEHLRLYCDDHPVALNNPKMEKPALEPVPPPLPWQRWRTSGTSLTQGLARGVSEGR
jgi:hypothetical protein